MSCPETRACSVGQGGVDSCPRPGDPTPHPPLPHPPDLDECALGTHNCSEAETCYNIRGGFRCLRFECPPNYVRVSET